MKFSNLKYVCAVALAGGWLMWGCATSRPAAGDVMPEQAEAFERAAGRANGQDAPAQAAPEQDRPADTTTVAAPSVDSTAVAVPPADSAAFADSLLRSGITRERDSVLFDSLTREHLRRNAARDSVAADSARIDTARRRGEPKTFLEYPLTSDAEDSIVYDVKSGRIYIYKKGDVKYGSINLQADNIDFDVATKNIKAFGAPIPDSVGKFTKGKFIDGGTEYVFDTMRYNMKSRQGLVRKTLSQQGEGFMGGERVKMHGDSIADMQWGWYTTCNHTDHPHFRIRLPKGRMIIGKKVIFMLPYFELEDVPIYFPTIPFGFFPLATGPSSGFIMPTFGEEYSRGFFLRGGGYYFRFNDYMDAQLTGSIYTLGSWDTQLQTRYMKRYKYSGSLSFNYSKLIVGERPPANATPEEIAASGYINTPTYSLRWQHSMDPKFRPGTTFSANVDFSSSGRNYGATNMNDIVNSQTNSSISYGKNWQADGRFPGANLSLAFSHSQNRRDSTYSFTFPNASWSVPQFKPFKRRNAVGRERWYEKVSLSYRGNTTGGNVTTKEKNLFKKEMFDGYQFGLNHSIPVSVAWKLFGGNVTLTPNVSFTSDWYTQRVDREWDRALGAVRSDTTRGFWATYRYSASAALGTKFAGLYQMKNTAGWLKAVRHVVTPSVSMSFSPDFSKPKYGYNLPYQTNAEGQTGTYSPFGGGSGAKSASMSFSLQQNLEAKIRDGDTTRIIKIVDNLTLSSGYNFLATQFKLNNISASFSTPITKGYTLNFSATLDPYRIDDRGTRIDRYTWKDGKLPRLTSFNTSFNWSLNKALGSGQPVNNPTPPPQVTREQFDAMDEYARAEHMNRLMNTYYDFSMPYNIGLNYMFGYSKTGLQKNITQTVGINGSITLTPFQSDGTNRWAITYSGSYDIKMRKLSSTQINIVRDLHCFTMSLNWIPFGYMRSWAFNIHIKASTLKDLKYDKSRSQYESIYD